MSWNQGYRIGVFVGLSLALCFTLDWILVGPWIISTIFAAGSQTGALDD